MWNGGQKCQQKQLPNACFFKIVCYNILFGLFSGVVGLFLSYFHAAAAGPMIVLVAAVVFFGTYFIGKSERN